MTVILDPYHAADQTIAWADRTDRARLLITGPDRVRFLQNLTTNDVRRIEVGGGCETFITTLQGKTLAFATLHADEDRILLRTDRAALTDLAPHLAKYGVFDEIETTDSSDSSYEVHLVGPRVAEAFDRLAVEPPAVGDLRHATVRILDRTAWLIRESPTARPGYTLIGNLEDLPLIADLLRDAAEPLGLVDLDPLTFDMLRIEGGTPVFGRDLSRENLPQELDRDARAISFTKGCYLGQETVARIDALGHVNKMLRGLRFDPGEPPSPGTPLHADGKPVGTVTSTALSPVLQCPIGLGFVRRGFYEVGRALSLGDPDGGRAATIVPLPMVKAPPGETS